MSPLPSDITYGNVQGRFLLAVGDTTSDPDFLPDPVPATGKIRFEPVVTRIVSTSETPTTVVTQRVECTIAENGDLLDPAGRPSVWLVSGQYKVVFVLEGVTLPAVTIDVTPAHTEDAPLWLPLAVPTPAEPELRWVVNEQVYLDTLAARDEAIAVADGLPAAVDAEIASSLPPALDAAVPPAVAAHIATYDRTGTGSPEGVVAAPVGTRYRDTAATTGAVEWVKTSGTGNTGWKVTYGDTGWRDMTSLMLNGWVASTASRCRIRRVNDTVAVSMYLNGGAATASVVMNLPAGFYEYDVTTPWSNANGTVSGTGLVQRTDGRVTLNGGAVGVNNIFCGFTLITSDPWPSTLPGTAA